MTRFLNEKYVQKKWADQDMKHDPLYLWENKRSRFDKFVKRVMNRAGAQASDSEEEVKPKESGRGKPKNSKLNNVPAQPKRNVPAQPV